MVSVDFILKHYKNEVAEVVDKYGMPEDVAVKLLQKIYFGYEEGEGPMMSIDAFFDHEVYMAKRHGYALYGWRPV